MTTTNQTNQILFDDRRLTSWSEVVDAVDQLSGEGWVFRGHERAEWRLQTSLEREFGPQAADVEQRLLWQFVRTAPRFLPSHLIPHDDNAAAWLGLIQHYGGPTRLLDVTRSPHIALFFAFEPAGDCDRAIWAIDHLWCASESARIMAEAEGKPLDDVIGRPLAAQAQLVYSLVHRQPYRDALFASFKPFTGVFPLDPWKPDIRQSAQQAMFLCLANPWLGFVENLAAHQHEAINRVVYRIVLPASLREEALHRLAIMNVTAATLFPDLGGLARSLRTHTIRRANVGARPLRETPPDGR
jgi:FRG domain